MLKFKRVENTSTESQCFVPGPFLGVVGGAGVVVDDPDDDVLELEIDL